LEKHTLNLSKKGEYMRNLLNSLCVTTASTLLLAALSSARAQNGNNPAPPGAGLPATNAFSLNNGATGAAPGQPNVMLSAASPAASGFGAGLILGEPTGLSLKGWLSSKTALDFDLGGEWERRSAVQMNADYLIHSFDLLHVDRGELPVYFGLGGRLAFPEHRDTRAGFRFPVGIAYEFPDMPVEVFAEIAPIIDVAPAGALRWNGGIGLRYYFH
jgi:hypothetical protein